ncbi:MAG: hypothetical protein KKF67_03295, partial [Nanoarchaeota archaeon]|nr:hypothetical protein [Nanoarchaeota archaeon]
VGVTLTSGQICLETIGCNPKGSVNYRIEENGEIIIPNHFFWTSYSPDKFNLTYWGTDDNSYPVIVSQRMCVQGTSFTENC